MKIKHLIIVSLILAILTIGAVSASEDLDNLTDTDDSGEIISQVEEVDIIAEDNSDGDVLGDKENASYTIYCKDTVTGPAFPGEWADYNGFISIGFTDSGQVSGNLTISIDDTVHYNGSVSNYSYENYRQNAIFLKDLDLSFGKHNATFKYSGNEWYNSFDETREFEYYYIKDTTDYDFYVDDPFSVSLARDANGTLALLIDNIKVFECEVNSYRNFEEENSLVNIDWDDLEFESDLTFGEHSYKIIYSNGTYPDKNLTGTINLDYYFGVENYDLDEGYPIYYAEPITFDIYLPSDATGNIVLVANGKTYPVNVDEDDRFTFNDLKYGENNLTFTYEDSKYPKKTVNFIFNVTSMINIPGEFTFNGDETIGLVLPSDAKGNLSVYEIVYDDDLGQDIEILIKTTPLNNGVANISLTDLKLGYYRILANYTGEDYNVDDAYNEIFVGPKVDYKRYYWVDGNNNFTVESPAGLTGNYTITLIYHYYGESAVIPLYEGPAINFINQALPKLNVTEDSLYSERYYLINIKYVENYTELFDKDSYKFGVKSANSIWLMNATFPKELSKSYEKYWYINNIPESLFSGTVILYIDNVNVDVVGYSAEEKFDGENYIPESALENLTYGNHTWKLEFIDRAGYFETASQSGTFELTWVEMMDEIYDGEGYVSLNLDDEDEEGYLSLLIDGKEYDTVFVRNGHAFIDFENIPLGEHTYELTYINSKTQEKLIKTGKFNSTQYFEFVNTNFMYSDVYFIKVELSNDATGNVTFNINGKTYTADVKNGYATVNVTDLNVGKYPITAKYSGDSKYPSKEISDNITVNGYEVMLVYNDEGIFAAFRLVLPANATGNLSAYTLDEFNDEDTLITTVELKNGVAIITSDEIKSKLKYDYYHIRAKYAGDDYEVEPAGISWYWSADVNITEEVFIGEDAKIKVDLGEATGNVTIYLNGEEFGTFKLENGKINVTIPAANLTQTENIITMKYIGESDIGHAFEEWDGDDDKYDPIEYYIHVGIRNLTMPTDISTDGKANITMELPQNYKADVIVYVNENKVSNTTVTGGKVSVPVSNLTGIRNWVTVEINGEDGSKYSESYIVAGPSKDESEIMTITTPTDSQTPVFKVNMPKDATGSLIVIIDGKSYTAKLVNGSATISVPGLADGTYNVTIKYSGDTNYPAFTKNTNVNIQTVADPELTISVTNVTEGSPAIITITTNKTFSGNVIVQIAGNNYTVKVVNGSGSISVANLAAGNYKAIAIFAATSKFIASEKTTEFTVTKKVTPPAIKLALKKVKVKKSAKKLVIKATLKINGKVAKDKKLKFKFNKKTYKAKTNKKGVAKITIKKKVLKKLKVGKKVTYQVSYGGKTAKRTVKVKK